MRKDYRLIVIGITVLFTVILNLIAWRVDHH